MRDIALHNLPQGDVVGAPCRCPHPRHVEGQGKTEVWNRGGVEPTNIQFLQQDALVVDPDAVVWRGDEVLPTIDQGVVILGTPLGHSDFVQKSHRLLLEWIPAVPDLQAAWLILLFCASARANFLLHALPPEATAEFARQHDESLRMCLSELLGVTLDRWPAFFTCCPVMRQSSFAGVPRSPLPPFVAPSPFVQPCLPVWPSTRSQWPPRRRMCCGGGFGWARVRG